MARLGEDQAWRLPGRWLQGPMGVVPGPLAGPGSGSEVASSSPRSAPPVGRPAKPLAYLFEHTMDPPGLTLSGEEQAPWPAGGPGRLGFRAQFRPPGEGGQPSRAGGGRAGLNLVCLDSARPEAPVTERKGGSSGRGPWPVRPRLPLLCPLPGGLLPTPLAGARDPLLHGQQFGIHALLLPLHQLHVGQELGDTVLANLYVLTPQGGHLGTQGQSR